jgi:hypothetical protein
LTLAIRSSSGGSECKQREKLHCWMGDQKRL